jgi:hypothetical protein
MDSKLAEQDKCSSPYADAFYEFSPGEVKLIFYSCSKIVVLF